MLKRNEKIIIPKKKCNKINCFNLTDLNNKYCNEHKELNKEYDKQRFSKEKHIRQTYTNTTWFAIRKNALLRDNGLCMYCLHNGKYTEARVVDHFIPVRDAFDDRYNSDNLVSSCVRCNTRKSEDEDKLRSNKITLEEYKHRWQHD